MVSEKKCANCQIVKDISSFYKHARGYTSWCKDCVKERSHKQAESGYFVLRRDKIRIAEGRKSRKDRSPEEVERDRERSVCGEMYRNARKRAFRNGKAFDLTIEWIESAVREFREKNFSSLINGNPFRPSLDRVDGKIGYLKTNVRIVWVIENLARNRFSDDQVVEFCRRKLNLL